MQEGLSGTAILRELREAGLGLRTQTFYRWLGQAKAEVSAQPEIVALEGRRKAPVAAISAWPTTSGRQGYLHIVNYTTKNRLTGFTESKTISVSSERLLSRAAAEAIAEESIRENEAEYPEFQTLGWSLTAVRELVPWEGE